MNFLVFYTLKLLNKGQLCWHLQLAETNQDNNQDLWHIKSAFTFSVYYSRKLLKQNYFRGKKGKRTWQSCHCGQVFITTNAENDNSLVLHELCKQNMNFCRNLEQAYLHDSPLYSVSRRRMLSVFAPTPLAAFGNTKRGKTPQ